MVSTLLVTPSSNWYSSAVTCVGEAFCACAAYNFVVLYDHNCANAKAVLRAHSNKVTAVAAAQGDDEEVVLSGGRDKALIAWSVRRQCVLRKQKKLPAEVTAIAVCPHDADIAMVALGTGAVSLWKWKKGGHELHASALSSAASVLRSLPRRPEQQGVVLAGCEDGSIVGLDSVTVTALWKVDITAACSPRKSPVFNGSKSSGGPRGNSAAKKGVQDISITEVPVGSADDANSIQCSPECTEHSQAGPQALFLAVTTRSCQLAVFGWPDAAPQHVRGTNIPDPPLGAACQSGEPAEGELAPPHADTSSLSIDSKPGAVPSPFVRKPTFLEQLSAPSPTSEVSWLPICWLPDRLSSTASEVHDQVVCTADSAQCLDPIEEGAPRMSHQQIYSEAPASACSSAEAPLQPTNLPSSRVQGQADRDTDAQKLRAWLLVGLPSGRMCLWSVKINVSALHELHELASHSAHVAPVQEVHSARAPATGSWRTGASGGGKFSEGQGAAGSRNSSNGGWRKSNAMEARAVKLDADDVHTRMLFTVHAIPGSVQDNNAPRSWQVITTSYDRKTVSWELSITEDGDGASMKAGHTWIGTGADVLAMCMGQARQQESSRTGTEALFVSTGEKHMRRFTCQHAEHTDPETNPEPQQLQPAALKLTSGSSDLFYQDIGAEISAMCCMESLIIAGCRDGTVGLIDTKLPALKAKLVKFSLRHDGPVLACRAQKSSPLQRTAGADEQDAAVSVAVEIFTLGADGNVLLWRGLPELAELHSLLRSNMGAEKIASLPKPLSLASSLPESVQQMCTFSSMELVQSHLLLGGSHGHLLVVEAPEPGEHSLNTALQSPSFKLVGSSLVHTAAVTAVAEVPLVTKDNVAGRENGQVQEDRTLVVAASASGSVAVLSLELQAASSDRALLCLAMLTDVSNAVTSLQLVPHPSAGVSLNSALDDADGQASATDEVDTLAVCDDLTATAVAHTKPPDWILCACAATDNVHLWTLSLHSQSESADSSDQTPIASDSKHVATYCGALKGLGHTAAPVCMQIVGHQYDRQHQEGATCDVQAGPSAALWLVVACTDRSIRAWPVTSKLVDMHRVAKLLQLQAPATEPAEQSHEQPLAAPSTATAAALPVARDQLHKEQPSELAQVATVCDLEAEVQPCSTETGAHTSSGPRQKLDAQADSSLLSTDQQKSEQTCTQLAQAQHATPGLALNDQEGSKSLLYAHSSSIEGAADPSSVSIDPQLQQQQDANVKPRASATTGEASAQATEPHASSAKLQSSKGSSQAHAGPGSCSAGGVQESVASQLSRFVGVSKTAEVSRLRPRASVLGTQSMLQSFVDKKLKHGEGSCLPGAARSTVDSEAMLAELVVFHRSDEVADKGAGKASKPAAGVRNAAVAAAHRIALMYLWQGDICRAMDTVIEADALNADFVAMAMGAGPEVWRAVVALYAAQLAACGEIHLAVGYLCSSGDFEQAVTLYKNSGLMLEALMLAERNMPPSSSILCTLRGSLQTQLAHVGDSEPPAGVAAWGVEVAIANGDVQGAVQKLVGKDGVCSDSSLTRACEVLGSEGYHSVAAELSSRAALGSRNPAIQKQWLQAAMSQDSGVACVAAAIGIVQELLDSLLDNLISVFVAKGKAVALNEIEGAASSCCSRFIRSLQPALPSSTDTSVRSVPVGFLKTVLHRAVRAIIGAVPQPEVPWQGNEIDACLADIDAVGNGKVDDGTQGQLQEMAQSVLLCVTAAISCIDSKWLLPVNLEDVASSVQRMLPALTLAPADERAAERVSVELAACFVAASLDVASEARDNLAANSTAHGCRQPCDAAALAAWEHCAASKCSAHYLRASGRDGDSSDPGGVLQPYFWQSTVLELHQATAEEARASEIKTEPAAADTSGVESVAVDDQTAAEASVVPVVSVLDSALQELSDLPTGTSDAEDDQSPYRSPDSAVAWKDPGTTHSPDRRRKGRAGQGAQRSAVKTDDLHWSEVEPHQRTVQAYTPQDWALFRREALTYGHAVTVFATVADDSDLQVQDAQAGVAGSGAVELERLEGEHSVREQKRAAVAAGDGVDVVVEGWLGALQMHPGRPMMLT